MTLATELAKTAQLVEYIVCVEGIGWPSAENDLSQGFDGNVFVTNDLNGDLATVLGCTIRKDLHLPASLTDEYDPKSGDYSAGTMRFEVQDTDGYLLSTIKPNLSLQAFATLHTDLVYKSTTVVIDESDKSFSNGDAVWVGGRECILLGTGSGGSSARSYSGCTRGYLGTPRGRRDTRPSAAGFAWSSSSPGTSIHDYCRFWYDRRVRLYAHVPGETVANCVLLYSGLLRGLKRRKRETLYEFSTVHEVTAGLTRIREKPGGWEVFSDWLETPPGTQQNIATGGGLTPVIPTHETTEELGAWRHWTILTANSAALDYYSRLSAMYAYNYRNRVSGGTAGVRTVYEADQHTNAPQANTQADPVSGNRYVIGTLCKIEGHYVRALHKYVAQGNPDGDIPWYYWHIEVRNDFDVPLRRAFAPRSPVDFLLDNTEDDVEISRFAIGSTSGVRVSRNVVDVLLMFLTTMPNEFFIGDVSSATTTQVTYSGSPSFTTDEWVGYTLFCVEGNNKGQARVITSNTASAVTVGVAFNNTPQANEEYQIRNSIYDVLPLGWGLGVHNSRIDIESFEDLRDNFLADAEVGRFALGDSDRIDLWSLMMECICRPYGILPYIDRTSGKLKARRVGPAIADGLLESYPTVTTDEFIDLGDQDMLPRAPLGEVRIKTRGGRRVALGKRGETLSDDVRKALGESAYSEFLDLDPNDQAITVSIRSSEVDAAFDKSKLGSMTIKAMLNSIDDIQYLINRYTPHVELYARPPVEVPSKIESKHMLTVQAGSIIKLTDTTRHNPVDPMTATRGWSGVLARVLGTELLLRDDGPALRISKMQLLPSLSGAKIAPASTVTGKGSDGNGDYFTVNLTDFVVDPDAEDWDQFAQDDRIELRDNTGATKEIEVIKAFGSNQSSTPQGASDARIYVDGTIGSTIATGDYVTFTQWSTSNTSNMDDFAAYADTNATLGGGNDPAKRYA